MSEIIPSLEGTERQSASPRMTLHLNAAEADALLSILLQTSGVPDVSEEMTEKLVLRLADMQRETLRQQAKNTPAESQGLSRRVMRRVRMKTA